MERTTRGRVILLNGASSSGKSSIADALVALLPKPWFVVAVVEVRCDPEVLALRTADRRSPRLPALSEDVRPPPQLGSSRPT